MRHIRGMTLMELLVALGVAAIILGIALPAFSGLRERTQLAGVRHQLTASLMAARGRAVTRRMPVSLCPSVDGLRCQVGTDWSAGWIIFEDAARTGQPADAMHVLRRFDALPGNLALASSVGRRLVRFQSDGRASGTNISLRLCSRSHRRLLAAIVVNNSGRARSESAAEGQPCPFAVAPEA